MRALGNQTAHSARCNRQRPHHQAVRSPPGLCPPLPQRPEVHRQQSREKHPGHGPGSRPQGHDKSQHGIPSRSRCGSARQLREEFNGSSSPGSWGNVVSFPKWPRSHSRHYGRRCRADENPIRRPSPHRGSHTRRTELIQPQPTVNYPGHRQSHNNASGKLSRRHEKMKSIFEGADGHEAESGGLNHQARRPSSGSRDNSGLQGRVPGQLPSAYNPPAGSTSLPPPLSNQRLHTTSPGDTPLLT